VPDRVRRVSLFAGKWSRLPEKGMRKHKTYLFVCKANVDRSKTAEDLCRKVLRSNDLSIRVLSAGTSPAANTPLTQDLVDDADVIFVMEEWMKALLETKFGQPSGKLICLDIPDEFRRGDELLQKKLWNALSPYLQS